MDLNQIKERVNEQLIQRATLKANIKTYTDQKERLETSLSDSEKAREIIQIVAQATMSNLEFHISNLVTLALKSVDPTFPEFIVKIEIRRNQTEVDFLFKEFDKEQKPMDSSGYGAVNVAAAALRVSFWSLDKTRHVMIWDEPFPDLSPDLQDKAGDMVTMLHDKLGIQFIIVSHAEDFNYGADRTFTVTKDGKRSQLRVQDKPDS